MATDLQPSKPAQASKYDLFVQQQLARARKRIRALDLAAAVLGLVAATLAYSLLMALVDRHFELPALTRQLAFSLFAVAAALYAGVTLIWPLCQRLNPYYAARLLEQTLPAAKNSVVNWLDLHDRPLPPALHKALGQRAAKDLDQTDLDRAISTRRISWLGGSTLALFLCLLVLFIWGPRQFGSLMTRAFAPFGDGSLATRTHLILLRPEGGNVAVPLGRPVPIGVQVEGRVPDPRKPDALKLHFRYNQTDPAEERPLKRGDSSGEWEITIPAAQVHNGFWYKVTGGDAETPEYRVQVRSTPLLTGFEVTYHYRTYLGWRPETSHDPNLRAPRGTEVTLLARTNRMVKEGQLIIGDEPVIAAERVAEDPQALRFRLVLDKDAAYRIWFTSVENERNHDPRPYSIRVLPDLAPQVELTEPGQDIELPCNGLLRLAGSATDDFGVAGLTLRMQVVDGPALQPKVYRESTSFRLVDGSYPQVVEYKDFVPLERVKRASGLHVALEPGQVIEYWLEAADNCDYPEPNIGKSAIYKVKLGPPQQDPVKQEQERQQARQEQQKHEKTQDQKQEQLNQERQAQAENASQPQDKPAQGGADQVRKQAEELQRAIEQHEREQGKGEAQGEKSPGAKGADKGEGNPEPKADQPQNPGQEKEADKGTGKAEPKGQQPPPQGEKGAAQPGSDQRKGAEKPEPKPGAAQEKGQGEPGSRKDSGQEQAQKQPANKSDTGQEKGPGKPASGSNDPQAKQPSPANTTAQPGQEKGESKPSPKPEKSPEKSAGQPGTGSKPEPQGTPKGENSSAPKAEGSGQRGADTGPAPAAPKDGGNSAASQGSTQGERRPTAPNQAKPTEETKTKAEQDGSAGTRQPAKGMADKGTGQAEESSPDISALAKELANRDEQTRREAARKLEELSRTAPDAQTRRAAAEALKQAERQNSGQAGPENQPKSQPTQGERPQEGQGEGTARSGQKQGKTATKQDPAGQERGQDASGQGKAAPGSAKESSPSRDQTGPTPQTQEQSKAGEPSASSGDRTSNQTRKGEPGEASGGPVGFGNREGPGSATKEADPGAAADPRYQKKAATLQLEDYQKRVNKEVLKDLNWTDEDYQKFLKDYAEMLKREVPQPPAKENLAAPQRGGGVLPDQRVRQVNPGSQNKAGSLERGGNSLPPPEFREAQRRFTQKLAELKREREQKGTSSTKP